MTEFLSRPIPPGREQAGAGAFDGALRCYLNATAWRVGTPAAGT